MIDKELIKKINNNEVVVFPTDTVLGLLVKLEKTNIQKINELKKRDLDQPLQILFPSLKYAFEYAIDNDYFTKTYLTNNMKEGHSYLVKAKPEFIKKYLNNNFNKSILIRIPYSKELLEILENTGPLFASSANIHGKEIINNFDEAKKTFNNIYIPAFEKITNKHSSKIIKISNNELITLR